MGGGGGLGGGGCGGIKKISSTCHLLNLPRESLVKVFSINPEFIIGIFFFFFLVFFFFFFFVLYKVLGEGNFQYWKSEFSVLRISGIFSHGEL